MRLRTLTETIVGPDTIKADLILGFRNDRDPDSAVTFHGPADTWLAFLRKFERWPDDRIERVACAGCSHEAHSFDSCGVGIFDDEGETPAVCPCIVDARDAYESPSQIEARDAAASGERAS